jgi:hypothetical protein
MSNPIDAATKVPLKAEIVGAGPFRCVTSGFARAPEDFDAEDILAVGNCGRRGDRSELELLGSAMSPVVK